MRTMRRAATVAAILLSFAGCEKVSNWFGGEHPEEHPEDKERPEKKEGARAESARLSKEQLVSEYTAALNEYLRAQESAKQPLPIEDVSGNPSPISGDLQLVRIHTDKIIRYEDNTYFACSDFHVGDPAPGTDYDLDFFMDRDSSGAWFMKRVLLHKIDGKLQLTYKENVPVPPD